MYPRVGRSVTWSNSDDLNDVISMTSGVWPTLENAKFFFTGATGFIGSMLLESLCVASEKYDLGVEVTVLSRNPERFLSRMPSMKNYPSLRFVTGNVMDFAVPTGHFTHVIHGATDASASLNEEAPELMVRTIVEGTRRVLNFAAEKTVRKVLLLSSGAVYGRQPDGMDHVREEWNGSPDCLDPKSAYAEGKRVAEMLCAIKGAESEIEIAVARIFALLGPRLNLDIHFAAGNFIRDAISNRPVVVTGDGSPVRSYLYSSDLTTWLWNILAFGGSMRAYNVGSESAISLLDLAQLVSNLVGNGEVVVLREQDRGWNPSRYVPDTTRAASELGLRETVLLEDAVIRCALAHGWKGNLR
jgi:dTDP-glucose 4,6-dehydratase